MSVTTDYPDYAPHVALAGQVAATGVPLLNAKTLVLSSGLQSIAAGGTFTHALLTFSQPSWEINVSCFANGASATPFVSLELAWSDSSTGVIIARETVILAAGSVVSGWLTVGRGPTKADGLLITATNLDGAHTMGFGIIILQSSRLFDRDQWQWDNPGNAGNAIPGFTLPTLPNDSSVLGAIFNGTVIASGNSEWLCGPGYGGTVNLAIAITTTPIASVTLSVITRPSGAYVSSSYCLRAAPQQVSTTWQFKVGRSPLLLQINNSSATAGTCFWMMTSAQDG